MELTVIKVLEDLGIAAAVCVVFLWIAYRNNKSLIGVLVKSNSDNAKKLSEVTESSKENNQLLLRVVEALRPATLLQSQKVASLAFDYCVSRTCEIVHEVKNQNHLRNESNTQEKINTQCKGLYQYVLLSLSSILYSNKSLDKYFESEWWLNIAKVVHDEVYNNDSKGSEERIKKNVKAAYDVIENEFMNKLNGK